MISLGLAAGEAGIRVEKDFRNEKLGFKIREAQVQKIPYMLVIGDKEANSPTLAVRDRGAADTREITKDKFIAEVLNKIKNHL